jgi:hypothetical protein
MFQGS